MIGKQLLGVLMVLPDTHTSPDLKLLAQSTWLVMDGLPVSMTYTNKCMRM